MLKAGFLKALSPIFIILILLLIFSYRSSCSDPAQNEVEKIKRFAELRKDGRTDQAYKMLSDLSKKKYSFDAFDEYCFVYRIVDTVSVKKREPGRYELNYKFYDKRFVPGSDELYTFYITENIETVKLDDTGIVFPHTGFLLLRKSIEDRDVESAEKQVKKMLSIDPGNPDVLKSAKQMGFVE